MVYPILIPLGGAFLAYAAFRFANYLYEKWTSPLAVLPGPPSPSFIYGNFREIFAAEGSTLHEAWTEEYGSTIKYKGFFGLERLYTVDTKALNHIIMNTSIYVKSEATRYGIGRLLGNGVLVVEGEEHKQQRRIMNPAFGAAQIRQLTEIFVNKSIELRNILALESEKKENEGGVNLLKWMSRATLDIIGLAGFNYKFDSLTTPTEKNELNNAFTNLFRARKISIIAIMRTMFPLLRPLLHLLPTTGDKEGRVARRTMRRVGTQLLQESKAALLAENEKLEKTSWKTRDLFSLLLRANMASDLPPSQRMVDEDVMAQVPTFLVAGHETTSTSTTWALYALCKNLDIQSKLREELLAVSSDHPTMDELHALPFLDAVVRESLRLHPPVSSTFRMASKDDIIPLAAPIKAKDGSILEGIRIRKGQTIYVPITAVNRSKAIYGEDAHEFKPDRWLGEGVPHAAASVPGVWGQMMTFIGGPRACIGYRFALVEMKALLFTLIRSFEFELAVPVEDIIKNMTMVSRPYVKSELDKGSQLPLRLRRVQRP